MNDDFLTASYYFWKWAENDLPCPPREAHAALLRGEFHPALQTFDARPLVKKLEAAAADDRKRGEEWDWQITPRGAPNQTRFVFVTCPKLDLPEKRKSRSSRRFFALDLGGCDAESGRMPACCHPKLNLFKSGQEPGEPLYDIQLQDLPVLLRGISSALPNPFVILENRRNHFVQCLKERHRFWVEWRENYDLANFHCFDQWRALETPPPAASSPKNQNPKKLLRFADTLRIFESFLRGEPRPARYRWKNINHLLP